MQIGRFAVNCDHMIITLTENVCSLLLRYTYTNIIFRRQGLTINAMGRSELSNFTEVPNELSSVVVRTRSVQDPAGLTVQLQHR